MIEMKFENEINDGLEVNFYLPYSNGIPKSMYITNINKEDIYFIKNNNLILTLEELTTGDIAVYLRKENEEEDDEIVEINFGRNCNDTISALCNKFRKEHKYEN